MQWKWELQNTTSRFIHSPVPSVSPWPLPCCSPDPILLQGPIPVFLASVWSILHRKLEWPFKNINLVLSGALKPLRWWPIVLKIRCRLLQRPAWPLSAGSGFAILPTDPQVSASLACLWCFWLLFFCARKFLPHLVPPFLQFFAYLPPPVRVSPALQVSLASLFSIPFLHFFPP